MQTRYSGKVKLLQLCCCYIIVRKGKAKKCESGMAVLGQRVSRGSNTAVMKYFVKDID